MLRKVAFAFCLCLIFTLSVKAQGHDSHQYENTTPPPGARYEIVQSPIAVRWTFRLDRYTGQVAQMVTTADERLTWESLDVIGLPKSPPDGKPRYQIFTSGIAARYTFLINVESGSTWQLMTDQKTSENYWTPFK